MEHFSIRNFLLASIILGGVSGCGGGGSDDGNGGQTSGDGTRGSGNTGNTSGARVAAVQYDLDNNGTFEGVERFSYGSGGRLTRKDATYTGDGSPDYEFDSLVLFPVDSATKSNYTEYTYDADGRVILEVTTYPVDAEGSFGELVNRIERSLTWSGGRVTETQTHFFDPGGAVVGTTNEQLDYDNEGRLLRVTTTNGSGDPEVLAYTYAGDSDLPESYEISGTSKTELTWSADRQLLEANEYYLFTDPAEHHSKDVRAYDAVGRLIQVDRTYPGPDPGDDIPYNSTIEYVGDSWKPFKRSVDESPESAPESVIVTSYQEGACEPAITFVREATPIPGENEIYQSGVGYIPLNRCYSD